MPKPLSISDIPSPSPAFRLVPGKSRAAVARAMGISVAAVARIERAALAKACAEMSRRGLTYRDLISLIDNPNQ